MNAVLQDLQPAKTLEALVDEWAAAKRAEESANKQRTAIEEAIIKMVGEKTEGSETHELADGRKLTVTAKITRTIDEAKWRSVMSRVPEQLRPITFVEVAKLDTKGLHWLMENEPATYAIVAQAIEAKKSKTALAVKV